MSDQPDHAQRGHSFLGASGAERWMSCPGSVALIRELMLPESDEPDYRREGTAMHEAAEHCLRSGLDTWEIVGQTFNQTVIDTPMADAIQLYLDVCRRDIDRAAYYYVETALSAPEVHELMFGTLDFSAIFGKPDETKKPPFVKPELVVVRDLKGGEGIVIEPEENPQLKYYAYLLIHANPHWADETPVRLSICQPRVTWMDPVREWDTTVGEIREWVHDTLVPAMARTELDNTLDAGPWCRFCPAKLVCPLLTSLFKAAATHNPAEVVAFSDEQIGWQYQYVKAVEFYLKALKDETFRRAKLGVTFDGIVKLVPKKANRVWKPEGVKLLSEKFGEDAFTAPDTKSPAEIEKLSPAAKEFVKEYAYTPDTGLTLAPWDDPKPGVKVEPSDQVFGASVAAALGLNEDPA